ncbi:hypothetical protein GGS23DRAFT_377618 [Durotheca rogersii]|uniref:uncharacterized protein n=1 Tax=Durotheca rogersii TaxID=419775 RepID=UPI00221FF204|nr:uncharacterized protein GGS23DRAFT_377618 [Durotheca rogersii]KAI5866263.1 hypothetical protein GGS23DRAFT_377618 [Durotheca rogersii]
MEDDGWMQTVGRRYTNLGVERQQARALPLLPRRRAGTGGFSSPFPVCGTRARIAHVRRYNTAHTCVGGVGIDRTCGFAHQRRPGRGQRANDRLSSLHLASRRARSGCGCWSGGKGEKGARRGPRGKRQMGSNEKPSRPWAHYSKITSVYYSQPAGAAPDGRAGVRRDFRFSFPSLSLCIRVPQYPFFFPGVHMRLFGMAAQRSALVTLRSTNGTTFEYRLHFIVIFVEFFIISRIVFTHYFFDYIETTELG